MKTMHNFIRNSLCKDCKHRVSRVLSSEGTEFIYDFTTGEEILQNIKLYSESCRHLQVDLEYTVVECSTYESKYNIGDYFFHTESILNLINYH